MRVYFLKKWIWWSHIMSTFKLRKLNSMHSQTKYKKIKVWTEQEILCAMPFSENKPGVSVLPACFHAQSMLCMVCTSWCAESHSSVFKFTNLSYCMAPKHQPATSPGVQIKKQWSVLTLQEKLRVLDFLSSGVPLSHEARQYGCNELINNSLLTFRNLASHIEDGRKITL